MQTLPRNNNQIGEDEDFVSAFDGDYMGGLEPTNEELKEIENEIPDPEDNRPVFFDPEEYIFSDPWSEDGTSYPEDYEPEGEDEDARDDDNSFVMTY